MGTRGATAPRERNSTREASLLLVFWLFSELYHVLPWLAAMAGCWSTLVEVQEVRAGKSPQIIASMMLHKDDGHRSSRLHAGYLRSSARDLERLGTRRDAGGLP